MTPRRIVLCLDGTWNSTYDQKARDDGSKVLKPSNALKLARAVEPRDAESGRDQITYYDIGVGALAQYPGLSNRLLYSADRVLGGAWGAGFEGNVEDAASFLAVNHQEGDDVFVFGFSRGAATARALTRFLDWAGGVPVKRDAYYLPVLFRAYVVSKGRRAASDVVAEINATGASKRPLEPFCKINVELLGVWDTVMALGSRFRATGTTTSIVSRSFHVGAQPAACVKHARQALAIDEARYDFRPEIWTGHADGQTLEQRWFAGVHSNVGGGYVNDGLANLAFRWILEAATARGLKVDDEFVKNYRPFPMDRLYPSGSLLYRTLDKIRFLSGKRALVGQPPGANLALDPSVIHRINADHRAREDGKVEFPQLMGKPYRPPRVLAFLASQPDLDQYLRDLGLKEADRRLPADVMKRIEELRARA